MDYALGPMGGERTARSPYWLLARWISLCALGEFFGIAAGAAWYGLANVVIGEPVTVGGKVFAWFMMALAAVPETLLLGLAQVAGLRPFWPILVRGWLCATLSVGLLGWGVGAAVPLFLIDPAVSGSDPGPVATTGFAMAFGAFAGALFGLFQALALPKVRGLRRDWILANVVGWGGGLPLIYLAAQAGADQVNVIMRISLWAVGGIGAGLCVGSATAFAIAAARRRRAG